MLHAEATEEAKRLLGLNGFARQIPSNPLTETSYQICLAGLSVRVMGQGASWEEAIENTKQNTGRK